MLGCFWNQGLIILPLAIFSTVTFFPCREKITGSYSHSSRWFPVRVTINRGQNYAHFKGLWQGSGEVVSARIPANRVWLGEILFWDPIRAIFKVFRIGRIGNGGWIGEIWDTVSGHAARNYLITMHPVFFIVIDHTWSVMNIRNLFDPYFLG